MLKRTENLVPEERPVGDLVHQLVDEGKAYAKAEVDLAKAMAVDKAAAYKMPAILLATAFLLAQAAFCALAVAVGMALAPMIGPLLGGIVAFLLFAGGAAGLAWLAGKKIKEPA